MPLVSNRCIRPFLISGAFAFKRNEIYIQERVNPDIAFDTLYHESAHYLHSQHPHFIRMKTEESQYLKEIAAELGSLTYIRLNESEKRVVKFMDAGKGNHSTLVAWDILQAPKPLLTLKDIILSRNMKEAKKHFMHYLKRGLYD